MTQLAEPKVRENRLDTVIDDLALLHQRVLQSGALGRVEKELIAMATSMAAGTESCIAYHLHNALEAGASREQVVEAVDVALMTMSEPSAANARRIIRALREEEAEEQAGHPYSTR